jgi:tRNA-specific 2-thiouridylase
VPSVELVTLGQRRGLGLSGGGPPRYVVDVDVPRATVTVGDEADLLVDRVRLRDLSWVAGAREGRILAQTSAHGAPRPCLVDGDEVVFEPRARRVAAGQSVVLYEGDEVVGAGVAADRQPAG